jgi:hypothetical protein
VVTILAIYIKGYLTSWRQHPLVVIYYLFNFLLSSLLTWPFVNFLSSILSRSCAGKRLFEQQDFTILIQLIYSHAQQLPAMPILLGYSVIFIFFSIVLSGGTLFVLSSERRFQIMRFFYGGILFYLRFLRLLALVTILTIFFTILYLIFFTLIMFGLGSWTIPILDILYLLLMGILLMLFDYARIITVLNDLRKVRRAFVEAARFVVNHLFSAGFLYLLYLLPVILLLLLHLILPDLYQMGVIIAFIYSQAFLLIRSYLRLSLLAGQMEFAQATYGRCLHP